MITIDIAYALARIEELADKVKAYLSEVDVDWSQTGVLAGQHHGDVAVDTMCVEFLTINGFAVFSEESGFSNPIKTPNELLVVLDPVDGSTNASRGLPQYALSAGLLHNECLVGGYVLDLTSGTKYWAAKGLGATWNGTPLGPAKSTTALSKSIVAINGYPKRHLGWGQYRAFGSASLELCMVASGQLDAFIDCSRFGLAPWDYMGALALLNETSCVVEPLGENDLSPEIEPFGARRRLVVARSAAILEELRLAWSESIEPE